MLAQRRVPCQRLLHTRSAPQELPTEQHQRPGADAGSGLPVRGRAGPQRLAAVRPSQAGATAGLLTYILYGASSIGGVGLLTGAGYGVAALVAHATVVPAVVAAHAALVPAAALAAHMDVPAFLRGVKIE